MEWYVGQNVSLRAEYRYSDYGAIKRDSSDFWTDTDELPRIYKDNLSTTTQDLRIGLTYHFDK
jgi:opacity protein-like surface antigen